MRLWGWIKYSKSMIFGKDFFVILMVISAAFFFLLESIKALGGLAIELRQPVELKCTISKNNVDNVMELLAMKGMDVSTEYYEGTWEAEYDGYKTAVKIVGYSSIYLSQLYGKDFVVSKTMPYLIIEKSFFRYLKDDKNQYFDETLLENNILENIILASGDNTQECRIIEMVDTQEQEESPDEETLPVIYTDLEGYRMIIEMNNSHLEVSGNEQVMLRNKEQEIAINEKQDEVQYLFILSNSRFLEETIEILKKNNIIIVSEIEKDIQLWEDRMYRGAQTMVLGSIVFVCGGLLIYYQNKLVAQQHRSFIEYIQLLDKSGQWKRKFYGSFVIIYAFGGIIIGGSCWGIISLFTTP